MLAVYNGIDEVIVIQRDKNNKPNRKEFKDYFGPGVGRDVEDYNLEMNPKSVHIQPMLKTL